MKKKSDGALPWKKIGLASAAAILLVLGAGLAMQRFGFSPQVMLASWMPNASGQAVYNAGAGMHHNEARKIYNESLVLLKKDKDFARALKGFQQLEGAYPGLLDWVLLHQAECLIGLGSEGPAQERLQLVLARMPNTPLKPYVLYQLGQSYFRGRQPQLAGETFRTILKMDPSSDYGIASLYYLGWLEAEKAKKSGDSLNIMAAEPLWGQYLDKAPDGRFAPELARELDKALPQKTPLQAQRIGLGYAASEEDWEQVKKFLVNAPLQAVWFELGQAQLKTGEMAKGVNTLVKGIPLEKDRQKAKDGIDMLVRNSKAPLKDLSAAYDAATDKAQLVAGDYLLWRLSQVDSSRAGLYYQVLLKHYADKDYAPESSWNLMWPLLKANQEQAFQDRASVHLAHYPQSKSAAKVKFWQAKLLERRQQNAEATKIYRDILKTAPTSYYAFRAYGRLMVLEKHQPDPGWRTDSQGKGYPPSSEQQKMSVIHSGLPAFFQAHPLKTAESTQVVLEQAKELEAIQASEDVALLFQSGTGAVPAAVKSWQEALAGDSAQSIRTIRDDLDERYKQRVLPTTDELKLLYPHYYSKFIQTEASRNQIDPVLAQSLMREESYFNPMAVSGSDARGLMQLLPTTAQEVARQNNVAGYSTLSLFAPEMNIRLGSRYLGYLHRTFQGQSMPSVGAYNGGPNAMKRWIQAFGGAQTDPDLFVESIPYEQTRDYIKKVFSGYWNYQRIYQPGHAYHQMG